MPVSMGSLRVQNDVILDVNELETVSSGILVRIDGPGWFFVLSPGEAATLAKIITKTPGAALDAWHLRADAIENRLDELERGRGWTPADGADGK